MHIHRWLPMTFLALLTAGGAYAQQSIQVPYSGTIPYNGTIPLTIPSNCSLVGTAVTCTAAAPPIVVTPPPGPARTKFIPTGKDDQQALYGAAMKGAVEVFCAGGSVCPMKLSSSTLPDGADIYFDDWIVITEPAAYKGWDHMFDIEGNKGINLSGSGGPNAALISMPLTYAQGNIQNNCVLIRTSTGVNIIGLRFAKCGEDSIYIGNGAVNVHVSHVDSDDPLRNGCSVTDKVTDVLVDYSKFHGAKNLAGGIADGCDYEPNGPAEATPLPGQFGKQVVFDHNDFSGNAGDGLCFCFYFINSGTPIDSTVTNNTASGNGKHAFNQDSWPSTMKSTLQSVKQSGNVWK